MLAFRMRCGLNKTAAPHRQHLAWPVAGLTSTNHVQNNAYLLGTCYYWCDKAYSAYETLSGARGKQHHHLSFACIAPAHTS